MQLSKHNEVYLKLDVDSGLSQELSDYFTFEVPGARFMPAYKKRIWDGKIRLFSRQTGKIYVGLLSYIKDYATKNNINIHIDEEVENDRNIIREDVRRFIKSLRPKSKGKELEIRDYQIDAVFHALRKHRCLLISPTASGKSLIIYSLIRFYNLLLKDKKILILVPTTSLVEQMYSDFIDYGWSDEHLHRIYSGHEKVTDKPVIISTWQSLYKFPKSYFKDFGCVVGDEAHLFKSKSLTSILTKLEDCKYRFGLTGTLDGTQTHKWVLEGLFGPTYKIIRTDELMKKGYLSKLNIKVLTLKHPARKFANYEDEIQYLITHTQRNNFIKNLTLDQKGNTLILYTRVESHGLPLFDLINSNKEENRKCFFVHGGVDTEDREEVRTITEKEDNAIIIASYGTFSTGINIKNLHNVIFASPNKSKIRNLQSIGRVLRKGDNKIKATLFDIADDITYGSSKNYTLNHMMERVKIYNEENFNYEMLTIPLKKCQINF